MADDTARGALSVRELADRWGIREAAVRSLLASGRLAAYRLSPRRIRISLEEIQRYEAAVREGGSRSPARARR